MRILILTINFHPELISTGRYASELAEDLASHGHDVRVVTTPPYYPYWQVQKPYSAWVYSSETWQGVKIYRCPLWVPRRVTSLTRILHLASFALFSLPLLLRQIAWRPRLVFSIAPAIFSAPFALLAARLSRAHAWLHVQDYEMDAAFGLGMLPGKARLQPLVSRIEATVLRGFDHVSTISERMIARAIEKGVRPQRMVLLPNWVDTQRIYPLPGPSPLRAEFGIPSETVIVLYHGNMGRKQGLEVLADAAACLKADSRILFVLCGEGATRSELENRAAGLDNVRFLNIQPEEKLNALVNMADIHVLPQRAGAADLVMPSKLTSMLASGRAIIACADRDTQVWKVVEQVGRVVAPEDARALADAILSLAGSPAERTRLGHLARAFAEGHLDRAKILGGFRERLLALDTE